MSHPALLPWEAILSLQSSSENSGPQAVADPLWERLKALVRHVLTLLQSLLLEHAGALMCNAMRSRWLALICAALPA